MIYSQCGQKRALSGNIYLEEWLFGAVVSGSGGRLVRGPFHCCQDILEVRRLLAIFGHFCYLLSIFVWWYCPIQNCFACWCMEDLAQLERTWLLWFITFTFTCHFHFHFVIFEIKYKGRSRSPWKDLTPLIHHFHSSPSANPVADTIKLQYNVKLLISTFTFNNCFMKQLLSLTIWMHEKKFPPLISQSSSVRWLSSE